MTKYMTVDDDGHVTFWNSDEVEKNSIGDWEPNHEGWDKSISDYPQFESPYIISSALLKKANKQAVKVKIVVEED